MRRPPIQRILAILGFLASAVLSGARMVLDVIGYSTLPEDAGVAAGRLDQFVAWLLSMPWWAPVGMTFILTVILIFFPPPRANRPAAAHVQRAEDQPAGPSRIDPPPPAPITVAAGSAITTASPDAPKPETAEELAAKHALSLFLIDNLLPTLEAQMHLNRQLLWLLTEDRPFLRRFAEDGLYVGEGRDILPQHYRALKQARSASSFGEISLADMQNHVYEVRRHYRNFIRIPEQIVQGSDVDFKTHRVAAPLWRAWAEQQSAMVSAYDVLCRDYRLTRIYSPNDKSFGEAITFDPPAVS